MSVNELTNQPTEVDSSEIPSLGEAKEVTVTIVADEKVAEDLARRLTEQEVVNIIRRDIRNSGLAGDILNSITL